MPRSLRIKTEAKALGAWLSSPKQHSLTPHSASRGDIEIPSVPMLIRENSTKTPCPVGSGTENEQGQNVVRPVPEAKSDEDFNIGALPIHELKRDLDKHMRFDSYSSLMADNVPVVGPVRPALAGNPATDNQSQDLSEEGLAGLTALDLLSDGFIERRQFSNWTGEDEFGDSWYPWQAVQEFFNEAAIRQALRNLKHGRDDTLVDFIATRARILFAIVVYSRIDQELVFDNMDSSNRAALMARQRPEYFALKEIIPPNAEERRRIQSIWTNEVGRMKEMNERHRDHIVRLGGWNVTRRPLSREPELVVERGTDKRRSWVTKRTAKRSGINSQRKHTAWAFETRQYSTVLGRKRYNHGQSKNWGLGSGKTLHLSKANYDGVRGFHTSVKKAQGNPDRETCYKRKLRDGKEEVFVEPKVVEWFEFREKDGACGPNTALRALSKQLEHKEGGADAEKPQLLAVGAAATDFNQLLEKQFANRDFVLDFWYLERLHQERARRPPIPDSLLNPTRGASSPNSTSKSTTSSSGRGSTSRSASSSDFVVENPTTQGTKKIARSSATQAPSSNS
ncbi:hypothetical protein O1611_g5461 [Lasiodiplodia mahajangana]|uniref:Uncharacterized protein n=1 Tax=Lasiodiplodia mahajangana TaxID=1108764 RepID=A0ACC2JL40_9PEZI|nr:hypothetical protein O1611_g5461 [Lasiodiplodia mahajangana]